MSGDTISLKTSDSSDYSSDEDMAEEINKFKIYHSAHGSLSTIPDMFLPYSDKGHYETHIVNQEDENNIICPVKVTKNVSGKKLTVIFRINSDMCTTTLTSDNSEQSKEGSYFDNLSKFHKLFTIELTGKGNEFIIDKIYVHHPSKVFEKPEIVVKKKIKNDNLNYSKNTTPPVLFYDKSTGLAMNIPNIEFFYEATFNTGLAGVTPEGTSISLDKNGKLWSLNGFMRLNKTLDKLDKFPIDDSDKDEDTKDLMTIKEISDSLNVSSYFELYEKTKKDYINYGQQSFISHIQNLLRYRIKNSMRIYFSHPVPEKSLLSMCINNSFNFGICNNDLPNQLEIYNSTCLVNQLRFTGSDDVYIENPLLDRLRYPKFYEIYEKPMDRSVLIQLFELREKLDREKQNKLKTIDLKNKKIKDRDSLQDEIKSLKKEFKNLTTVKESINKDLLDIIESRIKSKESRLEDINNEIDDIDIDIKNINEKGTNIRNKITTTKKIQGTPKTLKRNSLDLTNVIVGSRKRGRANLRRKYKPTKKKTTKKKTPKKKTTKKKTTKKENY